MQSLSVRCAGRQVFKLREALVHKFPHKSSMTSMFRELDADGNGTIEFEELRQGLKLLGVPVEEDTLLDVFHALDRDGNGPCPPSHIVIMY